MRVTWVGVIFGVLTGSGLYAQSVVSARSGLIHLADGRVFVDDGMVEQKFGQFPELKPNHVLRTEEGRVELLLTPGSFLRIGENSSVRMLSNQLTDTKVEVLTGSAIVECEQLPKDNAIALVYKGNTMLLAKAGLYRVDSDPARFRVYEGEAIVRAESGQLTLKTGRETPLDGVLTASKFDNQVGDELYRWCKRRSNDLAVANVSAARSAYTGGSGSYSPGYLGYPGYGGWAFNPWFGMYTFVPLSGIAYSPFGYGFWSPYTAFYYAPQYFYYGGGGYTGRPSPGSNSPSFSGRGRASSGGGARPVTAGGIGARGVASGGMGHGGFAGAGRSSGGSMSTSAGHSGASHR